MMEHFNMLRFGFFRRIGAFSVDRTDPVSVRASLDYAADGIRVLAVCPGTIDTEMVRTAAALEPDGVEAALVRFGRSHPIGRIGREWIE